MRTTDGRPYKKTESFIKLSHCANHSKNNGGYEIGR